MTRKNKEKGFSLIEVAIVVGILAIISTIGIGSYAGLRSRSAINSAAGQSVAALRDAMQKAQSGEDGTAWGVRFQNEASGRDYFVTFSGDTYASSTKVATTTISSIVDFTAPTSGNALDVIFQAATGLPTATTTSTISLQANDYTDTITVETSGRISRTSNYYQ